MVITFNEDSPEYSAFTNDASYGVRIDDCTWPTVTHYLLSHRYTLGFRLREAESPEIARKLAAASGCREHPKWSVRRDGLLYSILMAKFTQHLDLEQLIVSTGETELVYESATDLYDGRNPVGCGHNMLGRMLMRVRRNVARHVEGLGLDFSALASVQEAEEKALQEPDHVDKLVHLMSEYFDVGWYQRAITVARAVIARQSNHEWAWRGLALSLIRLSRYEEALEPVRELTRIDPYDGDYFRWLAELHRRLGQEIPAKIYARRARRLYGEEE